MNTVLLFMVFSFITLSLAQTPPKVTTPLGIIEGTIQKTYTGNSFFQFEGIPYAAPPVGNLRFENPQLPKKWSGILKATVRTFCYQYTRLQKDIYGNYAVIGDEDCLYYNVYTPSLNTSANLNVMIHIHGGAFMLGSGELWRPDIILNKPIVLVTFNYRLGPLGFLSTEDNVLPGNLGLKDQQEALKWIKKNIKHFGGNPNSITLHGFSAGSASVQMHCLSPGSKGLFHRAIGESGSALNNWVLMEKSLEKAKHLASLVGCPTSNSIKLKNCMKTKPARLIVQNVKEFQPFMYNPPVPWAAVVDGKWASNPVLPDHPLKLLLQKKIHDVPLLMSFTSNEGITLLADFLEKEETLSEIDARWNELMPYILMYNDTVNHSIIDLVSQKIRQEYLGTAPLERCTYPCLAEMFTDRCFVADLEKGLRLHSAGIRSPVWAYEFNYTKSNLGASHGDDTVLIIGPIPPVTPEDIAMSNFLLDMTMSFILTGSPNISTKWKPISKNVDVPLKLFKINRYDDLQLQHSNFIGNRPFWDSLPIKENEKLLNINLGF